MWVSSFMPPEFKPLRIYGCPEFMGVLLIGVCTTSGRYMCGCTIVVRRLSRRGEAVIITRYLNRILLNVTRAREFEDFIQQFLRLLPRDLSRSREDLEKVVRASMNATFSRMNLVTREEFDVQSQLLANTRAALDDLQEKIAEMEKALSEKQEAG